MKRITLSIITGVCLMIAGQASAHSGHHSHSGGRMKGSLLLRNLLVRLLT